MFILTEEAPVISNIGMPLKFRFVAVAQAMAEHTTFEPAKPTVLEVADDMLKVVQVGVYPLKSNVPLKWAMVVKFTFESNWVEPLAPGEIVRAEPLAATIP